RGSKRRPSCTVQNSMVVLEMDLITVARHAQTGGNSAFADGQNGSNQKDLGGLPNRFGEQGGELYNQGRQFDRQCGHRRPLLVKVSSLAYKACRFVFKDLKMDKVQLRAASLATSSSESICLSFSFSASEDAAMATDVILPPLALIVSRPKSLLTTFW